MQETSMRDMLVSEIFFTALSKGNPFVKQEIFQWLSTSLPEGKGINKVSLKLLRVRITQTKVTLLTVLAIKS
jgi:hypothetical protein